MSNKLKGLLRQINDAANEVASAIQSLDERIANLQAKRQSIGDASVSQAEFLEYIGRELDQQAGYIGRVLARALDGIDRSFFALENRRISVLFLTTSRTSPVVITEDACFWYLKPAIMARMAELTESMVFAPAADLVPVETRRAMIAEIDAEIDKLRTERDELAAQLEASGIIG